MKLIDNLNFAGTSLVLEAPSQEVALKWVNFQYQTLAQWALKFGYEYCRIRYPGGGDKEYRIPARFALNTTQGFFMNSDILKFSSLYTGNLQIYSAQFINVLNDLLERRETASGVVRLRDNTQIIVTSGCTLLSNPQQGISRRREQYWHPGDLLDFNQSWQQVLTEDGSNTFEFTYRALEDPSSDNQERWGRFTTQYRLFRDNQEIYHLSEGLDFAPIPKPEGVLL